MSWWILIIWLTSLHIQLRFSNFRMIANNPYRSNYQSISIRYPTQWLHSPKHRPHVSAPNFSPRPRRYSLHPIRPNHHSPLTHLPKIPLSHQHPPFSRYYCAQTRFLTFQSHWSRINGKREADDLEPHPRDAPAMSEAGTKLEGVLGTGACRR